MYAIIQTGGKQYKVKKEGVIEIDRLSAEGQNKEITFNEVLFGADQDKIFIGKPFVKGASVVAEFLGDKKGPKIVTYKYKSKKNYHKTIGHRQILSRVRIKEISLG